MDLQSPLPLSLTQKFAYDVILVPEDDIKQALKVILETDHMLIVGSGAVGVAELMENKIKLSWHTVVYLKGQKCRFVSHLEFINCYPCLGLLLFLSSRSLVVLASILKYLYLTFVSFNDRLFNTWDNLSKEFMTKYLPLVWFYWMGEILWIERGKSEMVLMTDRQFTDYCRIWEMQISELTIKIFLLFLPGIISKLILQNLTLDRSILRYGKRKWIIY